MALVPDAADDEAPEPAPGTLLPPSLQLLVLSFLMLFVELALIRWSGALVICLSYFSNLVLLGSFLSIGIGFLRGQVPGEPVPLCPGGTGPLILFRPGVPGLDHQDRVPDPVRLREVPRQRAAHMGHAAHRVPGRRRRHGDDRRGRRPDLHTVPAAGRLPAGYRGQNRRHRGLLAALVPRRQAGHLNAHRRGGHATAVGTHRAPSAPPRPPPESAPPPPWPPRLNTWLDCRLANSTAPLAIEVLAAREALEARHDEDRQTRTARAPAARTEYPVLERRCAGAMPCRRRI
jgi:hypothetical protein